MASAMVDTAGGAPAGQLLIACVAELGTASHSYSRSYELLSGANAPRNLSDLVHFLCMLHGRYPGVIDHAASRVTDPAARAWLADAGAAFAAERAYLARLAVEAGPVPGTPGSADSDSAVRAQRHAMEMLATSERNGCALGAAMALMLDWASLRRPLSAAGQRLGVESDGFDPEEETIRAIADSVAATPSVQRALSFGAQQLLIQQHGLWDLLEVRQQARGAS